MRYMSFAIIAMACSGENKLNTIDDGNGGKIMWEALGMTEAQATTIKNNQQWWHIRQERDRRLKLTDWISGDEQIVEITRCHVIVRFQISIIFLKI